MNEGRNMPGQIQGITNNGEIRNIRTDENGNIMTSQSAGGDSGASTSDITTIICEIVDEEKTIQVNKYVTEISVANYSEENNITLSIDEEENIIGANIAFDMPVNKNVSNISVEGTSDDIKLQLVVKGVK